MALREEPAGRVRDDLAAVGVLAIDDEAFGFAFRAEAERLVGQQFVAGEAVVQFDDVDVLGCDRGRLVDAPGRGARHVVADHVNHGGRLEGRRRVGRERLGHDADGARRAVPFDERLARDDGGRRATGRRATLEARERVEDHGALQHLVEGQRGAEERPRVVLGVPPRLDADLRERFGPGAILGAVFAASAAEHLGRDGRVLEALQADHDARMRVERVRPVGELGADGALLHLLEADGQHDVGKPAEHGLAREPERRRARGAVVVDVDDGNARLADFVDRALARRRIAVDVAHKHLLDGGVFETRVGERLADGAGGQKRIVVGGARLLEGHHANPDDVDVVCHAGLLSARAVR